MRYSEPEWWYQCVFDLLKITVEIEGTARDDQYIYLENIDLSQGGRAVKLQSPWDGRKITALYPFDFMGFVRAPCGNLAIAARGPYEYPQELIIIVRFFFVQMTI